MYQGVLSLRVDDVMETITDSRFYLIFLININNPTLLSVQYRDLHSLGKALTKMQMV